MKLTRFPVITFAGLVLLLTALSRVAFSQTIYTPYAFTTLSNSPGGTFVLSTPYDVAVDKSNHLYVAVAGDHTIRKISLATTNATITTLAGVSGQRGADDGVGAAARFFAPESLTVDNDGNVYVADTGNLKVRKITGGGLASTVASLPNLPLGIARNNSGTLYATSYADTTDVYAISPGGAVSIFIPSGSQVQFQGGLAVDTNGNIFAADSVRNAIFKITPGGGISTIAGSIGNPGAADGIGSAARFRNPFDLAVDQTGNIFVADSGNNTIRKITWGGSNWVVTTIGGIPGVGGSANGSGDDARFSSPHGIAVDDQGTVYVADTLNGTIRAGVFDSSTVNSWTNSTSGKWEDGYSWSVNTPSSEDEMNYITNAGTKIVLIDSATATTAPDSLTINNLFVAGPAGSINGLVVYTPGVGTPLNVLQELAIDSGGAVSVTNGTLNVGTGISVGYTHGNAALRIFSGGKVFDPIGLVGNDDAGGNAVNINGAGSTWTNSSILTVGYFSDGNGLIIENGGSAGAQTGAVGQSGNNNAAVVTDVGSAWRNSANLTIGQGGAHGNALTILNGGAVYVGGDLDIGTGGDGNQVTVANSGSVLSSAGAVRLTRGGQLIYNALYIGSGASVETTSLSVSNGNFVGLAGGSLSTGGTLVMNGVPFPVGVGTEPATLHLNSGTHTFGSGLVVTDHAFLTGCGTINGAVTIETGGTVRADTGCQIIFNGPVTNNGTLLLNGTNTMFFGALVNRGSIITNTPPAAPACLTVVTGNIVNLPDSNTYEVSDGTNSAEFNWSVAGPGASGYLYATFNTQVALATGITNVAQITNAANFEFATNAFDSIGPVKDAEANDGNLQFVILRNKYSLNYAVVRLDDIQDNGNLNASWWFQTKSGSSNFSCNVTESPAGPSSVTNLTLQASSQSLGLSFSTQPGRAYTIQIRTNLTAGSWQSLMNFPGDGSTHNAQITNFTYPGAYYRILTQ